MAFAVLREATLSPDWSRRRIAQEIRLADLEVKLYRVFLDDGGEQGPAHRPDDHIADITRRRPMRPSMGPVSR